MKNHMVNYEAYIQWERVALQFTFYKGEKTHKNQFYKEIKNRTFQKQCKNRIKCKNEIAN